jgi:hypothetical protein
VHCVHSDTLHVKNIRNKRKKKKKNCYYRKNPRVLKFFNNFALMTTCTFKLWIRILHHGKPFDSIRRETTSKMKSPNCRHDSSQPNQILRPDFHAIWRVHARTLGAIYSTTLETLQYS